MILSHVRIKVFFILRNNDKDADVKSEKKMQKLTRIQKNSAHADGGPRSRVCARETLRLAPH